MRDAPSLGIEICQRFGKQKLNCVQLVQKTQQQKQHQNHPENRKFLLNARNELGVA